MRELANGNKWFLIFFPIFLAIQLYQSFFLNWDPYVYFLQGKWFCGEEIYFEFLRAPLPGAVHCAFGAGQFAPQLAVILACALYLAALLLLFTKEKESNPKTSQFVFAAFSLLFPTILWNGNFGSDLFALSFLLIAFSTQGQAKGLLFGLSTLSRYNFVLYAPIFLLQVKGKGWLWFFAGFLLVWAPWLSFNFAQTGEPLFSVGDFLYLNIVEKGIAAPLNPEHAGAIIFFFASAYVSMGLGAKSLKDVHFLVGVVGILQFLFSGVKDTRFLDVLVPLQALFLGRRMAGAKTSVEALLVAGLFALLAGGVLAILLSPPIDYVSPYTIPEDGKLMECRVMSDRWVYFYPKGIVAEPLPQEYDFGYFLKTGTSLVIYDRQVNMSESPDYDIIIGEGYLLFRSKGCAQQPKSYIAKVWRRPGSFFLDILAPHREDFTI